MGMDRGRVAPRLWKRTAEPPRKSGSDSAPERGGSGRRLVDGEIGRVADRDTAGISSLSPIEATWKADGFRSAGEDARGGMFTSCSRAAGIDGLGGTSSRARSERTRAGQRKRVILKGSLTWNPGHRRDADARENSQLHKERTWDRVIAEGPGHRRHRGGRPSCPESESHSRHRACSESPGGRRRRRTTPRRSGSSRGRTADSPTGCSGRS